MSPELSDKWSVLERVDELVSLDVCFGNETITTFGEVFVDIHFLVIL